MCGGATFLFERLFLALFVHFWSMKSLLTSGGREIPGQWCVVGPRSSRRGRAWSRCGRSGSWGSSSSSLSWWLLHDNYLKNFTIGTLFILNSIGSEKKNHTWGQTLQEWNPIDGAFEMEFTTVHIIWMYRNIHRRDEDKDEKGSCHLPCWPTHLTLPDLLQVNLTHKQILSTILKKYLSQFKLNIW